MKIVSITTEEQLLAAIHRQEMDSGSRLHAIRAVMDTFNVGIADAVHKYDAYTNKKLNKEKYG